MLRGSYLRPFFFFFDADFFLWRISSRFAIPFSLSVVEWISRISFNLVPIKISQNHCAPPHTPREPSGDFHDVARDLSLTELRQVASRCCPRGISSANGVSPTSRLAWRKNPKPCLA
jgi:hypothetical protein